MTVGSGVLSEGTVFGIGNPLLDIQAIVDKPFLDKWGLKENDAILCDDKLVPMFNEMTNAYSVEYIAGGSTQNTFRVAQWIVGKPGVFTFTGCIGKDGYGQTLQDKARAVGINTIYQVTEKEKTGTCAACIIGHNRSLCAHLAAANCFTKEHLLVPDNAALMEKAGFYYIAGFVLTVSPEAIMHVAQHACDQNKPFMMNLSAPFLAQFFKEPMLAALPYVDILFGNETEAATFAKEQDFGTENLTEIALKIAGLEKKNTKRPRIVIITQGAEPVIIAQDGKTHEVPQCPLKPDEIVDTNGAGDAFAGGFISQFVQGKPLDECVRCGSWAAKVIIGSSGCTYPEKCEWK